MVRKDESAYYCIESLDIYIVLGYLKILNWHLLLTEKRM